MKSLSKKRWLSKAPRLLEPKPKLQQLPKLRPRLLIHKKISNLWKDSISIAVSTLKVYLKLECVASTPRANLPLVLPSLWAVSLFPSAWLVCALKVLIQKKLPNIVPLVALAAITKTSLIKKREDALLWVESLVPSTRLSRKLTKITALPLLKKLPPKCLVRSVLPPALAVA